MGLIHLEIIHQHKLNTSHSRRQSCIPVSSCRLRSAWLREMQSHESCPAIAFRAATAPGVATQPLNSSSRHLQAGTHGDRCWLWKHRFVSCVVCRLSCVVCCVSCVVCRVSCVVCRVSCVVCPVPCVLCSAFLTLFQFIYLLIVFIYSLYLFIYFHCLLSQVATVTLVSASTGDDYL